MRSKHRCVGCITILSTAAVLSYYFISDDSNVHNKRHTDPRVVMKSLCYGKGIIPLANFTEVREWDFTDNKAFKLLNNFKNPCFFHNVTTNSSGQPRTAEMIRCLPYFIIAGFPKAGTTDMWMRLLHHPDVVIRHIKEPMFFTRGRYRFTSEEGIEKYIQFFNKTSTAIERLVSPFTCNGVFPYHHGITGEASVDTAFDNSFWTNLPANRGCSEPIFTNADYIYRLNPKIKVIFLVRNPIDRLYSDYIYEARFLRYKTSKDDFHRTVLKGIALHEDCRKYFTLRGCAFNDSIETFKMRLRVGMYSVFIEDWMRVFPRDQILVIPSADTIGRRKIVTYNKVCRFLDIRPYTMTEEVLILDRGPINARSIPEKEIGDMLPITRHILSEFYKPFNEKLAKLLTFNDETFLWQY